LSYESLGSLVSGFDPAPAACAAHSTCMHGGEE
jgi:hypothetical protein